MSDMTLSEAAAEIAKWGNFMRAFGKAQEVIAAAQAQEQLRTERTAALEDLRVQTDAHRTTLENLQAAIEQAKQERERVVAAAQADAARVLQECTEGCNAKKGAAEEAQRLAELEVRRLNELAAQMNAQRVTAQAELDDLQARAAAAREAQRKVLAGE